MLQRGICIQWTGMLDRSAGMECWSGVLEWSAGVECWNGLWNEVLDWSVKIGAKIEYQIA